MISSHAARSCSLNCYPMAASKISICDCSSTSSCSLSTVACSSYEMNRLFHSKGAPYVRYFSVLAPDT
jgi:hypothetical protein